MRVPFNWLKEFTPVGAAASEVAEKLTMRGLEVEAVEQISPAVQRGLRGQGPRDRARHPSAEKLSLCRVDVGGDVLPIVCGAPNVAKGQKVAVAVPGRAPRRRQRRSRKDGSGASNPSGMLCSEKELGLSDDHSGIFVLPDELKRASPWRAP